MRTKNANYVDVSEQRANAINDTHDVSWYAKFKFNIYLKICGTSLKCNDIHEYSQQMKIVIERVAKLNDHTMQCNAI